MGSTMLFIRYAVIAALAISSGIAKVELVPRRNGGREAWSSPGRLNTSRPNVRGAA